MKRRILLALGAMLPTSSKGFLPDQPKNSAADEKIQPHTIFSIKG
jgi:hypothetical protein